MPLSQKSSPRHKDVLFVREAPLQLNKLNQDLPRTLPEGFSAPDRLRRRALLVFPPSDEKHRQRRVLPKRLNQYREHHSSRESQLRSFPRAGLHPETVRHSPWSAAAL